MKKILPFIALSITLFACKKEAINSTLNTPSNQAISQAIALNINHSIYHDLAEKSSDLESAIQAFSDNPSQENLSKCRDLWKSARSTWELSESFIYGPVATENIDPRIDSWPVDFNAINLLLAGTTDFSSEPTIDALDDALKGFHPIEFILWGENGNKQINEFTTREKEYLIALVKNLKKLTEQLENQWDSTNSNAYVHYFTGATLTNPYYETTKDVFEEIVNGMIGICEEVAAGKMGEPLTSQDPGLEESPFSSNSMIDFTNNIKGVQNVYLGNYAVNGLGLEDLVRQHNLSLDNLIKTNINSALASLATITAPFGQAIFTQQTQVSSAITAIETLKNTLENQLLPFVQQHVKN